MPLSHMRARCAIGVRRRRERLTALTLTGIHSAEDDARTVLGLNSSLSIKSLPRSSLHNTAFLIAFTPITPPLKGSEGRLYAFTGHADTARSRLYRIADTALDTARSRCAVGWSRCLCAYNDAQASTGRVQRVILLSKA